MTDATDAYVKCWLEDTHTKGKIEKLKKIGKKLKRFIPNPFKSKEKKAAEKEEMKALEPQETDTHWRCRNGKASWNWRMKFNVELPRKFPYLHFQLWDRDILKYNDCIAECNLDCEKYFKQAHRYDEAVNFFAKKLTRKQRLKKKRAPRKGKKIEKSADDIAKDDAKDTLNIIKGYLGLQTTGDAQWLNLYKHNFETDKQEYMGKLLVSIEILPEKIYKSKPAGFGRAEPNTNPRLPAPIGRLRFSWNPFYMLMELLGPKVCTRCVCVIICVAVILLSVFGAPFITSVFSVVEPFLGDAWFWILVVVVCGLCCACCVGMELHAKYKEHLRELEEAARDAEEARMEAEAEKRRQEEEDAIIQVDDEKKEDDDDGDGLETKNPITDVASDGIELQEKRGGKRKNSEKSPLLAATL